MCGFNNNGTGYCPVAEGQMQNNITTLVNFLSSSSPPICHISVPMVCFSKTNWNLNATFITAWITVQNLMNYPLYQANDYCVQDGYAKLYWYMMNGNYVPPTPPPTPSGASFYGAVIALVMLLL